MRKHNRLYGIAMLLLLALTGCQESLNQQEKDFISKKTYLEAVKIGTPLTQIQTDLDLDKPFEIEPPSRLYPAYLVRYKIGGILLALAADADDSAPDTGVGVEYLKFRGDVKLWVRFRDEIRPAPLPESTDSE